MKIKIKNQEVGVKVTEGITCQGDGTHPDWATYLTTAGGKHMIAAIALAEKEG